MSPHFRCGEFLNYRLVKSVLIGVTDFSVPLVTKYVGFIAGLFAKGRLFILTAKYWPLIVMSSEDE